MDTQDRKCLTMLKREKWDDYIFKNINISDFLTLQKFFLLKIKYSCFTSAEESKMRNARISYFKLYLISMSIFKFSKSQTK